MTSQAGVTLASGLTPGEIDTMLRAAEPRRLQVLSASLNLTGATLVVVLAQGHGSLVWPLTAMLAAWAVWRLSERLWRDLAIAVLAPAIGERWGQLGFASGWGAVEIERWVGNLFSEEGSRFVAWQSHGRYRDTDYRMNESTIWRRSRRIGGGNVRYVLEVEVAVPQAFSGSVEIAPRSGFIGRIDDLLRRATDDPEQRHEVDPEFDEVFDTIASTGTAVDALLTPGFRRAMLALGARHPDVNLTARFEHGWFSLRLPIPSLVFASVSLTKPMTTMTDEADALWWDLTVPHRLIDALMGDHDGALR